jgi:hypothetical protein
MADPEVLAAIKDMGNASKAIIDRLERSEAKAKEMDEKVAALAKSAATAPVADEYARALARGQPFTARADETATDFVERLVVEENERQIVIGVRNKSARRGRHIGNTAGLDLIRTFRAIALAKLREGIAGSSSAPSHDSVLRVFNDWGDKRGAGLVEEARDLVKRAAQPTPDGVRQHVRAQNSSLLGAGAGFVSTQTMAGFIDFNWPKTVVRALGAMSLPVSKNSIELLYIDSAAGASRRGQLQSASLTSVGEKRMLLTLKLLSAFIAASNELLDESDISLDVFYRAMLSRAVSTKENLEFLTSLGSQNEPKGVDWWVDSTKNPMVSAAHRFNRTLDTGLPTFKTARKDLLTMQQIVAEEDIDLSLGAPGYALSTATKFGLMRVMNVNDIPVFGEEMRGGTLLGAAYGDTTQIPKNEVGDGAGSGTGNKAKIYFGDWSSAVIAEDPSVDLKVQDGGTYRDAGGNVITGLTTNESIFVIHAKNDFGALQRGKEFCRLDSTDFHAAF